MKAYKEIEKIAKNFERLPGVGKKTALRYTHAILEKYSLSDVERFASELVNIKKNISECKVCGLKTFNNICDICEDDSKDHTKILVVKDSKDAMTIESTNKFNGVYHVLGALISLVDGIGPGDINLESLEERVKSTKINEVILAIPFTPNGETTALFIEKILKEYNVKTTRIGYGLPAFGDIQYIDELTLIRALENKR